MKRIQICLLVCEPEDELGLVATVNISRGLSMLLLPLHGTSLSSILLGQGTVYLKPLLLVSIRHPKSDYAWGLINAAAVSGPLPPGTTVVFKPVSSLHPQTQYDPSIHSAICLPGHAN